jgi:uncharacterized protein YndB with AHSA1/START domain
MTLISASLWSRLRSHVAVSDLGALSVAALLSVEPGVQRPAFRQRLESPRSTSQRETVRVTKVSDRDIVVAGTFAVPRSVLFEALTKPDRLKHWMSASGMELADVRVDARAGGSFRQVFKRPSGRTIEVRGAYRTFDPPRSFMYLETYDFSPLRIEVTTALEETGGETRLTRTMHYFSPRERDEDYEAVATSSRKAYAKLAGYVKRRVDADTAGVRRDR